MPEALHDEERIMRYLDGLMSGEEKKTFEADLLARPDLRESVESMKLSIESARLYGIRQQVAGIHSSIIREVSPARKKTPVVRFRKVVRYTLAAAASIILLVLVYQGYLFYQLSPDKLYNESFVSFDAVSTTRGETTVVTPIQKAFSEKDYKQVIALGKTGGTALPDKDRLLVGLAYQHSDDPARSIKTLEPMSKTSGAYKEDAEYYLALAYLKNEDYDKAIGLMRQIRDNENHLYHAQFSNSYIRKVRLMKWK